jgi:hypothetical protein
MLLEALHLAVVPPTVVEGLPIREALDGRPPEPLPDDGEVSPRRVVLPNRTQLPNHEVAVPVQDRVVVGTADAERVLAVAGLGKGPLLRVRDLRTEGEHESQSTEEITRDVHLGASMRCNVTMSPTNPYPGVSR